MRKWIDLAESATSVLDFENVTVDRRDLLSGNPRYAFVFKTTEGMACVTVRCLLDLSTHDLNIYDVQTDVVDHPRGIKTRNDGYEGAYENALDLGPGETRRVFRYILDRVRADGYEVKSVGGERVTGARAHSDPERKMASMDLAEDHDL